MMSKSSDKFENIKKAIIADPMNAEMRKLGYLPLYTVSEKSKIVIIGQAPGRKAQETGVPWNDPSGDKLRTWLGIDRDTFYDPDIIALLPMDFYYPGKGKHGDLPPRKGFAEKWHPQLLALMPDVKLIIVIGAYAQKHCLGKLAMENLTETVFNYKTYLPKYFPLVHPSPLNFRWQASHPWFEKDVVPELQKLVKEVLR